MTDLKHLDISKPFKEESLSIRIEDYISFEKLEWLNKINKSGVCVTINLCLSENYDLSILQYMSSIKHLKIHPAFDFPLDSLEDLNIMNSLQSLEIGDYTLKNISFSALTNIRSLNRFKFSVGINTQDQYDFINNQQNLKHLHVKTLDLKSIRENVNLKTLRLDGALKNAKIMNSKLPDLENIHIHNASVYKDFDFLQELANLQSISIYNTNKLKSFPRIKNPEHIKSVSLYNCSHLENIEELLTCKKLENLAIIVSPLKKIKLKIEDFEKLKILGNLKTVHTDFGKISDKEYQKLEQIYCTNQWENRTF